MPYIKSNWREHFDDLVDKLVFELGEFEEMYERPGAVNYVISRIVASSLLAPNPSQRNYASISQALAIFRDAEAEMRRRVLDPYENKAIERNGDIPEYEE